MGKKWLALCFAGCFGVVLGVAGIGSGTVYAAGGKKLAAEGTVFDLKSHTSGGLIVYGYVSDKALHPVADAIITVKPSKGPAQTTTSNGDGAYSFNGIEDNVSYSISAKKSGLGNTKQVRFKVGKNEFENFIVNLQFKKIDNSPPGGGFDDDF